MGRYIIILCAFIVFLGFYGAANAAPIYDVKIEGRKILPPATTQEIKVIGNRESNIYYLPGMKFYNVVEAYHRVEFASEADAIKAGYKKALSDTTSTTTVSDMRVNNHDATSATTMKKIKVVGNKDSKRYHLPGMKFYNAVEAYHRVEFASEADAIRAGYHKAPR